MEHLQLVWLEPYDVKVKLLKIVLMTERVVVPFLSMRAKKVRKHLFVEKGSMHRVKEDVMRDLVNFVEMIIT